MTPPLAGEVGKIERQLMAWHRQNQASQRLETIPGVGIITATALAASLRIRPYSDLADSLRPGWGSCHGRTRRAARTGWGACQRWGMGTCVDCWSSGLPR
ncbi:hypothetical protein SAMN04488026_105714 [Aliiruegeria lutimaris]|uniref:Transposase IS116/IS110/IS902 family protein n=1 Tax=Aliiruegeria lutimaris TaxID=571298 RepID=A0A1G9FFR0_9RHOB|nr:hypothetical protein SAMN04488026_105714 [Aliiruegeria lutimaris]